MKRQTETPADRCSRATNIRPQSESRPASHRNAARKRLPNAKTPARLLLLFAASYCHAATYEVGPGRGLERIGEVPWHTLAPGDVVLIHWRAEPYREKWVICAQGTESAPITVRGVANENGDRPVIDADGAVTPAALNYWNEERSLIKIGGANRPADAMPRWIVVEGLNLRGARRGRFYTGDDGAKHEYATNAAALFIEKGENISIRDCVLSDSGNGLFIGSPQATPTRDILIERNSIHGNGNDGSAFEHNSYTEALGITFQFNHYGPLKPNAQGNNLKDRSAGLIVRYNWIEAGNRQLDLVDAGAETLRQDPSYRETFVYGNILVEPAGAGNRQIVHYGGDSSTVSNYRKGKLWFFHNTVISTRDDRTTLFRLSTNDERCEAWNNVFFVTAVGSTLSLLDQSGQLNMERNLLKPQWVLSFGTVVGAVTGTNPPIETDGPSFWDFTAGEFHPAPDSLMLGAAVELPEAIREKHGVNRNYVKHRGSAPRGNTMAVGALAPDPESPVQATSSNQINKIAK